MSAQLTAFFTSVLVVTLAEMGDKTQLLAFALATRFRQPWTVLTGIFLATVLNHLLAASLGGWVNQHVPQIVLVWLVGVSFIGFGFWTLIPDTYDEDLTPSKYGPLVTTTILFFVAEIGDKTQLATIALGAKYGNIGLVVAGTTLGMMIADGLAVFLGSRLEQILPLDLLRRSAAGLFMVLGLLTIGSLYVKLPGL